MEFKPIKKVSPNTTSKSGLLLVRTANECIQDAITQPIPEKLCGNFWFENEVSILFADTNVGKSILAVQIADKISGGNQNGVFGSEAPAQRVLYLDFELSDKQFENRYSNNYQEHYSWDSNFLRVRVDINFTDYEDFEKQLFIEIESIVEQYDAKIVIVDNITFLRMQSTEQGKEAMPLMKYLTKLKQKYKLSLLVLAHTPKRLNPSVPLSFNDLAGRKHLSNFADSIFCIGKSNQNSEWRYIKQLKARSSTVMEMVFVCELRKLYNFLGFDFLMEDYERNHLKPKAEVNIELEAEVIKLKKDNPDFSLQKIANEAGTNKVQVKRILDRNI
jgi:RecA-family ATPase